MANDLRDYANWLRKQACRACLGPGPCLVHHPRHCPTYAPGERQSHVYEGKAGKGQRASDYYGISLHIRCHEQLHRLSGPFRDFDQESLRVWSDEQVQALRAAYEASEGAEPGAAVPAPLTLPPVANDPKAIAQQFCSELELGDEVALRLERLLRSFERRVVG
jgi:transcription initiation factor TFIIIB Brf1 subunit/transcription initiation factor TFIIB